MTWSKLASVAALAFCVGGALPAQAGNYNGDFLVRIQGTVVAPSASADVSVGGVVQPGWDADVSTEVIPTLTLTYFLNKNIAAELFCCFAKFNAEGTGGTPVKDLGDFWVFPPIVTLQYHFDSMGGFKPYVGAGVEYMAFFGEGNSALGGAKIDLDNAWGLALQAGFDMEIGQGWYLNADVKKVWLDTNASWKGTAVTADVTVDPWIVSVGLGYRFNLSDVFGSRGEPAPLK
jgi:outer membrane protein